MENIEGREGYKKTELGWVPEEWEVKTFFELIKLKIIEDIQDGNHGELHPKTTDFVENGIPFIMANCIEKINLLNIKNANKISKEQYKSLRIGFSYPGDILLTHKGSVGLTALVKPEHGNIMLSPQVTYYRIKQVNYLNKEYLYYYLQSPYYQNIIKKLSTQSTRAYIGITAQKKLNCILPQIQEQKEIAQILSCWDKAIERTEKLINARNQLKKGLMQKLLTGKKRFKEFIKSQSYKKTKIGKVPEDWQVLKASDIFKNYSDKNHPEEELLSATQDKGVLPRNMLDGRVTMPEGDVKSYKLVNKGDFVISLRSFQGGIEYSEYRGIVSPAYTVLKNIIPIEQQYYKYLFKSVDFISRLSVAVIGIRDGKQISYSDFAELNLYYPSIEEQQKIASVLSNCDREIELLQNNLNSLKNQKKGLMQKLLTGQIRVSCCLNRDFQDLRINRIF
ncbi:MAG: restriction endonuclease subunit S [Candidatus Eremiobacterota bacterium]